MELKGRIAVDDLMAASRVHARPRRSFAVLGILLLGLAVFVVADSFLRHGQSLTDPMLWILPGSLAYLAFMAFVWAPKRVRQSYRQRKDFQHEISMLITSAGIETRTEQGHVVKPWSDYLKWKEGNSIFLLYLSDHLFQMIPKHFFAANEDIDAFRDIVKQSVK